MAAMIRHDRLRTQLAMTGLSKSNPTLYQVIDQLIDIAMKSLTENEETTTGISGDVDAVAAALALVTTDLGLVKESDFLTFSDESASLMNSRQLIAGTGITFNDAVAHQRTIASTGGQQWSVLTDSDSVEPELIYAGGDVIMTHIP